MFLNSIKNFFIKKIVKKSLLNVKPEVANQKIRTVGIVLDESHFYEREALVAELVKNGIDKNKVRILVFRDKIKKNEQLDYPVFTHKDLSWSATFNKSEVKNFIAQKFDLLINYYDTEKPPLLLVSNLSKANFKAGFPVVDKKISHLLIETNTENYQVFVGELFKYLKILNKI